MKKKTGEKWKMTTQQTNKFSIFRLRKKKQITNRSSIVVGENEQTPEQKSIIYTQTRQK